MISFIGKMPVAQLVVRNIENGVKAGLQRRARRSGRSMEEEVRDILRAAVNDESQQSSGGLGTEISALFAKVGIDREIPELRGHRIKAPTFEK